jgi:hypothetical protein
VPPGRPVLLDDRLLVGWLLEGGPNTPRPLATTSSWWFRACRAAVVGAGGHLSGPFRAVDPDLQEQAVLKLLDLPDAVVLPDARRTVPEMARIARDHPRLNLLNLDAVASAAILDAEVWLSPKAAEGILPGVLDQVGRAWRVRS